MIIIRAVVGAALVLGAASCQTTPKIPDTPASRAAGAPGYQFNTLTLGPGNTDGTLVILAFSGGGARAAAMAFGVLEALHATRIGRVNQRRTLLSEVDVISGTSGGSFTAAFYGLFREATFARDKTGLSLFERRYLKRPVTSKLAARVTLSALRILTPAVNRSDVVADYYAETIFGGRTFGDLHRAGRPFIVINSHDTTKLSRFVFTQEQFALICNDLSQYPVSRAVVASSAVHGIFAPIKLRNFSPGGTGCPAEPLWVANALRGQPAGGNLVETSRDRLRLARLARWYRNGERYGRRTVAGAPYYVHLADGGVMDNLALVPILRALGSPISTWGLQELIARGKVRRILLIVVNAMPSEDRSTDRVQFGPTLDKMLLSAVDSAIKKNSHDALRMADAQFRYLRQRYRSQNISFHGPVVVGFDGIADPRRRRCFRVIETALDLPAVQIDALRQLAVRRLEANGEYRSFLRTTHGRRTKKIDFGQADRFCKRK